MSSKQDITKRVLVIPDKFKGSLTSDQVCLHIKESWLHLRPHDEVYTQPIADGGEGSIDILAQRYSYAKKELVVSDPLFRPIKTFYYTQDNNAFIQMASAAGYLLLSDQERNCINSTSYGVGQMIIHAIENDNVNTINLFIGGSATNDVGIGMAIALGYRFLDNQGKEVLPTGGNLSRIVSIDESQKNKCLTDVTINIISDVDNPLLGPKGAAHTYAPQKGATPADIKLLEKGAVILSDLIRRKWHVDISDIPGGGAAGGMGAGAVAFLHARIISGIEFMISQLDIDSLIQDADVIITGEGKVDEQSLHGKVIHGIMKACAKYDKELYIVCGMSKPSITKGLPNNVFIRDIMSIAKSTDDAMKNASTYLRELTSLICAQIN